MFSESSKEILLKPLSVPANSVLEFSKANTLILFENNKLSSAKSEIGFESLWFFLYMKIPPPKVPIHIFPFFSSSPKQ